MARSLQGYIKQQRTGKQTVVLMLNNLTNCTTGKNRVKVTSSYL